MKKIVSVITVLALIYTPVFAQNIADVEAQFRAQVNALIAHIEQLHGQLQASPPPPPSPTTGGGGGNISVFPPGVSPIPILIQSDRYSWARPLADLESYAQQAVRWVFGNANAQTALPSSRNRWIRFPFISPRPDGVVLASDINRALAEHPFDLVIAQSESGFDGNIFLADQSESPLFNAGFFLDDTDGLNKKVRVVYSLVEKISLPVPADLEGISLPIRDQFGNTERRWIQAERGRISVPNNIASEGTVTARFKDGTAINFNLGNGLVEGEKRTSFEVEGEFAHTIVFPRGERRIVFSIEGEWLLNQQGEFRAIFEPESPDGQIELYAEVAGRPQTQIRFRHLPDGVFSGTDDGFTRLLKLQLPPGPKGVYEAIFTFELEPRWDGGKG